LYLCIILCFMAERRLRIANITVNVYGSRENYELHKLRPLRPSDYVNPRKSVCPGFLKCLSAKSRNHPRSEKPKRSFLDKAHIIWKRFARRRNSGKAKN